MEGITLPTTFYKLKNLNLETTDELLKWREEYLDVMTRMPGERNLKRNLLAIEEEIARRTREISQIGKNDT